MKKRDTDPFVYIQKPSVNFGSYDEDQEAIEEEMNDLFNHLPHSGGIIEISLEEKGKQIIWRKK